MILPDHDFLLGCKKVTGSYLGKKMRLGNFSRTELYVINLIFS